MLDVNTDLVGHDTLHTLSRGQLRELATQRIAEISKEFADGFRFLEDYPKSVTFFGSNQTKEGTKYYEDARKLAARIVSELGYAVVSGGGPGIMEAANRGAQEAGGESLGLVIKLPKEQAVNHYVTKEIASYYFFVRKVLLSFSAEAYVFYPGGYGTLDEFFELLTLVQTKKVQGIPIICVGSEYWHSLQEFINTQMLERGAIDTEDTKLFTITDSHDEVIDIIKKVPVRVSMPFNLSADAIEQAM